MCVGGGKGGGGDETPSTLVLKTLAKSSRFRQSVVSFPTSFPTSDTDHRPTGYMHGACNIISFIRCMATCMSASQSACHRISIK